MLEFHATIKNLITPFKLKSYNNDEKKKLLRNIDAFCANDREFVFSTVFKKSLAYAYEFIEMHQFTD